MDQPEFPCSFYNLDDKVREKAIETGNALIQDDNTQEGKAIAIAISKAREVAASYVP